MAGANAVTPNRRNIVVYSVSFHTNNYKILKSKSIKLFTAITTNRLLTIIKLLGYVATSAYNHTQNQKIAFTEGAYTYYDADHIRTKYYLHNRKTPLALKTPMTLSHGYCSNKSWKY